MSLGYLSFAAIVGLLFVALFWAVMLAAALLGKRKGGYRLRALPALGHFVKAIGLAVESGSRLHLGLGRGGVIGARGAVSMVGLSLLERIARVALISDRPPAATSGDGAVALLAQDTLRSVRRTSAGEGPEDAAQGLLTGATPLSYAAGTLPILYDEQVSATLLAGHFGSEAALIADAATRKGGLTMGGSDSLIAQAALYAAAEEPLIGEEVFASGAYLKAGAMHNASLRAQDFLRWALILAMIAGAAAKFAGLL